MMEFSNLSLCEMRLARDYYSYGLEYFLGP